MTGQGKKTADKSFTILVLPHSGEKSVSFPLRASWLKAGAAFLAAVVLAVTVLAVRYTWISKNMARYTAELKHLQEENSQQKTVIDDYTVEASEVQDRLGRLEDLDREIREIIGKEAPLLSSRSGTSQANPRLREQRLAFAEVSRDGSYRRQALFSGLIEEARHREESLAALKEQIVEVAAYLKAKPSAWPTIGQVTSAFGYRRSPVLRSRKSEFHEGIDIGANHGSTIRATGDGVVAFAGYHGGLGRAVVIEHGYGIRTWYGHCSKTDVRQGQKVTRGQVVARVGSSGLSTGPHLHYQVTVNGKCVDPREYLGVSQLAVETS